MKVRIPAQTVEVDATAWATEYGVPPEMVREDVKSYFSRHAQTVIEGLELQAKTDC